MLEDRNLLSTFTVDHLADDMVGDGLNGSLRYCITNAGDNDTITFGVNGTINLTGALPDLTHSVSIQGPGASLMTVRRDTGDLYRIFTVAAGTTVSMVGLTIANGSADQSYGGGIYNGGTLTLNNCTVSGNAAGVFDDGSHHFYVYGGGIYNSGTLTLNNVTVSDNIANFLSGQAGGFYVYGGGIYNSGALTLNSSTVSSNLADARHILADAGDDSEGGGIYSSGTLTLNNCTVRSNSADSIGEYGYSEGDGIYSSGTLTVTDTTISDSPTAAAIFLYYGTATITNCTISGNRSAGIVNWAKLTLTNSIISGNNIGIGNFGADGSGGESMLSNSTISGNDSVGIFNTGQGAKLILNNCTVSGNVGYQGVGGGIINGATLTLNNSTISGNHADLQGGGVYNDIYTDSTLHARNTIIAGNTAPSAPDLSGNLGSLGHNLIGNTQGASGFDPTDLLNVNPLLGPLQNNGGPTKTMALLPGSPAIDAGDNAGAPAYDQRGPGFPRIVNGIIDIGAFEVQPATKVTHYSVSAPATAGAGSAFNVTVNALNDAGNPVNGYTGTVHFSSSDGQAVLPSDYTFTSGDAGVHTFTNGVTLKTAGNQTVTATDTSTAAIAASASVGVNPAAADHLLFLQQPANTAAGQTITPAVRIEIVDAFGNVVTTDNTDTITLAIGNNPSSGTLSGRLTVTVNGGIATFSDLSIDLAGDGYTLHATSTGLTGADSAAFSITA